MVQQSLVLCVSLLISPTQVSWWLLCNMKHDTSSIILYMCLAISAPLHMASVVSRHPNPSPQATGCFCGNRYIALLFLRGNGVTMMSDRRRSRLLASKSDRMFNNWPYICSAGPIANSSNLTFWRQQLWVIKGLRGQEERTKGEEEIHINKKKSKNPSCISVSRILKHNLL